MSKPDSSRWPRQIKYIIGNEACERFSYYGMTGILAGYISGSGRYSFSRGVLGTIQGFGGSISNVVAGELATNASYDTAFAVLSLAAAFSCILVFLLPRSSSAPITAT